MTQKRAFPHERNSFFLWETAKNYEHGKEFCCKNEFKNIVASENMLISQRIHEKCSTERKTSKNRILMSRNVCVCVCVGV